MSVYVRFKKYIHPESVIMTGRAEEPESISA